MGAKYIRIVSKHTQGTCAVATESIGGRQVASLCVSGKSRLYGTFPESYLDHLEVELETPVENIGSCDRITTYI